MGTEKIEEEVGILFPEARIKRMDLDTTRSKKAFQKILSDFENQKTDILIGTQMVSKGLDFEMVRLVGVLNADNLLYYPDFRSYERTFQLLAQVSGRAGRKKSQGQVIIQTSDPEHPVLQWVLNDNYKDMYRDQMAERKRFLYPPYYRLIKITLRHKNKYHLDQAGASFGKALRYEFGNQVLGPEAPLISRIQNWYLKVVLIKFEKDHNLFESKVQLTRIISGTEKNTKNKGMQIIVDVDPQ
jgi:primosomal protein N' (replication factor Y)